VPVYNVEKYLDQCLESLYQQTLHPEEFEIILVDDKSTDKSLQIAKEFKKTTGRENIKILENKQNLGLGETRNKGIREAKGEYLYFLDSDDYLDPTTLENLLIHAYLNDSDIVVAGFYKIDDVSNITMKGGLISHKRENKFSIIMELSSFKINPMACNRLVRKSLFIDHNISFPTTLHEDVFPMFKLYFYADNISCCHDYFYFWRTRESSITQTMTKDHIDAFLGALSLRSEFLLREGGLGLMRKLDRHLAKGVQNVSNTLIHRIVNNSKTSRDEKKELLKHLYKKIKRSPNSAELLSGAFRRKRLIDKFISYVESENTLNNDVDTFFEKLEEDIRLKESFEKKRSNSLISKFRKLFKALKQVLEYPGGVFKKLNYFWTRGLKYLYKRSLRKKAKRENRFSEEQIKSEVLFFCEANYHVRNAAFIIRNLRDKYEKVSIVDLTGYLVGGRRKLKQKELEEYQDIEFIDYNKHTCSNIDLETLKVAVFFNDWGTNHEFIRKLRNKGILTIGIDEGVNDFLKLGEGFTSKVSPYRTCEHVFLPGEYETQFFDDRPGQYHVIGLPMIRKLYEEKVSFPKKPLAVINVNFTYGVLTFYRDLFVRTAIEGCKKAGIDYVITQHPMDNGDLSEYNITDENMYDTIRGGSIFISRFSGAIVESLAMGKPCVYHNPHNEKILKFQEPMGAYSISDSADSLAKAIKYELNKSSKISVRKYSKEFMKYHANIGDKEEPAVKSAGIIKELCSARELTNNSNL
jgi:glycosyltransferase involved in cell wall biosynthesis